MSDPHDPKPTLDYEPPDRDAPPADPRWAAGATLALLAVGPAGWGTGLLLEDPDAKYYGLVALIYGAIAGGAAALTGLIVGA